MFRISYELQVSHLEWLEELFLTRIASFSSRMLEELFLIRNEVLLRQQT